MLVKKGCSHTLKKKKKKKKTSRSSLQLDGTLSSLMVIKMHKRFAKVETNNEKKQKKQVEIIIAIIQSIQTNDIVVTCCCSVFEAMYVRCTLVL